MPDGKKRPRKRSRKSKGANNPGNEAQNGLEIEDQNGAIENVEDQPENTAEDQASTSQLPSVPVPQSQTSLSKSYPRPNNPSNSYSKPNPPPRPVPQQAPPVHSGPKVSFHERTNPHKPSVIPNFEKEGEAQRGYTLSVAIPGSIVRNAQTPELQSRLAGHIGRTCAIFNVDEIVVFDDGESEFESQQESTFQDDGMGGGGREDHSTSSNRRVGGGGGSFDPGSFLARVLQYLETPQYLRKALFPMHKDLRLAGLLPPLDCPHHLRFSDQSPYREGVVVETPHWATNKRKYGNEGGSGGKVYCNIGLKDPVEADCGNEEVPMGTRVTVKIEGGGFRGRLVSPREPTEKKGIYWGYSVRLCNSLSGVLVDTPWIPTTTSNSTEVPDDSGYDLVIGTSERGISLTDILVSTATSQSEANNPSSSKSKSKSNASFSPTVDPLPPFKHAIIVFGGLSGLEVAVERDEGIQLGADDANQLFDSWINVVEGQGSRTIRTEEALMIALARLKSCLEELGK